MPPWSTRREPRAADPRARELVRSLAAELVEPGRAPLQSDRNWIDPPPLVVEVLSPSTRHVDQGLKRLAYARLGVPSYWIVDPREPSLLVIELGAAGDYVEVLRVAGDEPGRVQRPFPVTVVPRELLAGSG